jgi:hypothetical protein
MGYWSLVKLPDQRSGLPGEVLGRFHIASLDPDQRSELAGSRPVNQLFNEGWPVVSSTLIHISPLQSTCFRFPTVASMGI